MEAMTGLHPYGCSAKAKPWEMCQKKNIRAKRTSATAKITITCLIFEVLWEVVGEMCWESIRYNPALGLITYIYSQIARQSAIELYSSIEKIKLKLSID